jgi:flagellar motor protein MotB
MARRPEDATIWIGYADFLSTLAILLFILVVAMAAKIVPRKSRIVTGTVIRAENNQPIAGCVVTVGKADTTDGQGGFVLRLDSAIAQDRAHVDARCSGYEVAESEAVLTKDSALVLDIRVQASEGISVQSLPGDALFEPNEYMLKPEAARLIADSLSRVKALLRAGDVVAVQGHTDDLEFAAGAGKDNLMLSSQRAWAAARVLYTQVGISRCQVVTMGFGSSRPIARPRPEDGRDERARKRAINRRIEFRLLKGSDLVGGTCAA